jgi:GTP diphosphokinase / guanosine-3',5'-bis(diphosphate) 3'-diphosphatase
LLHDAVEDQDVTSAEIADLFGPTVASLAAELTDDKSLPKQVRKDEQIAGVSHKSGSASVIKLADKTSNLLAIANRPPPPPWPPDRKRAYVEWAGSVVSGLPSKPAGLMARSRRRQDWRWKASSGKADGGEAGRWIGLNE